MSDAEIIQAAKDFVKKWENRGKEERDTQTFWDDLFRDVFGVTDREFMPEYERPVKVCDDNDKFSTKKIDVYVQTTKVLIEQKSLDVSLDNPLRQSEGTLLTAYQQAKRYADNIGSTLYPKYIITCNFKQFRIYDMDNLYANPEVILLEDLPKEYYRLKFLIDENVKLVPKEQEVSEDAGRLVGLLYNKLLEQSFNPDTEETKRRLNILCVRLVFCLYAEDSNLFAKNLFYDFLNDKQISVFAITLEKLFDVLNTPIDKRDAELSDDLRKFPYVNGGLFAEKISIPQFTDEMKTILLEQASIQFDWKNVSPSVFGTVFESSLDSIKRRQEGMHYTSTKNIHRVIDPLFLDELYSDYEKICLIEGSVKRKNALLKLQDKLSKLKFLDPACGSGNFLTETFLSLRRLENDIIRQLTVNMSIFSAKEASPIKVTIDQFYGIELDDFAVTVARTALNIADSQMWTKTQDICQFNEDFLPLKYNKNIVECNALEKNWNEVIPASEVNYIMGNPPFHGARLMEVKQKEDLFSVTENIPNNGNLDYVTGWYFVAAKYIQNTTIRCAFVSTNSICQGEQVAILWKPLMGQYGVHIDFAWRTFEWDNVAHVYCVIVGFSSSIFKKTKYIFDGNSHKKVQNINPYLVNADNIFIENRTNPLCDIPKMGIGNKPIDGGNYLFTKDEMKEFIKQEPLSKQYFKKWYGSQEFINQKPRYCLWLGDCSPAELRKMPKCMERVENVRNLRLASKSAGTRKIADKPTRFHVENMPFSNFIVVPKVSTSKRKYIPMGFMTPDVFCSDLVQIIPNATLYHFGVLTSNVHMAWMRAVCGRLGNGYRYSKEIVYNNFPWCSPTDKQKAKIEETAQAILDARAKYPDSSLADLYDELTMPADLRKAHQANDKAVMEAYGFDYRTMTESECVAELMKMYQELVENTRLAHASHPL